MRRAIMFLAAALLPALWSTPLEAVQRILPRTSAGTLWSGGLERTYRVHMPARPDPTGPMPAVLILHGGGGTGEAMERLTQGGLNRLADREGFIAVYPDGIERRWNDGRGVQTYRAHRENVDDVGFVSALTGHHQCPPSPAVALEPDRDHKDGTRVRRETYAPCRDGTEVILLAVEGGGHTWPGDRQYLPERIVGRTSRDIDANEAIWAFFKPHAIR